MTIEQLLIKYFYSNKVVTLQGIGTFTLADDFILPAEIDKEIITPENAVSFQYNSKATEDDSLINFIVQHTRKIKPLASADLDSYLVLGKQFLNIGKPFKIEGLGMLEKNQLGEYEFKQGVLSNLKAETATSAITPIKEKGEERTISFASKKVTKKSDNKKGLYIAIFIVGISFIGCAVWYFFIRKNSVPQQQIIQPDNKQSNSDTTKLKSVNPATNDSYTFKIVFKETNNKAAAISKMNSQIKKGHKVIMYTKDSVLYKLAEPFTLPLSDTTKIKDSLNRYFYLGGAHIEVN